MWESLDVSGLGTTSKLSVCRTPIVRKQYNCDNNTTNNELFGREVVAKVHFDRETKALNVLGDSKHFPALAVFPEESHSSTQTTPYVLFMEFCGEPLTHRNMPTDWKEQLGEITSVMRANDIFHNDMHEKNFCVINGVIVLVDFGWSTDAMPGYPFFNLKQSDIDHATDFRGCIENMLKRVSENAENYNSEMHKCATLFKIGSINEEINRLMEAKDKLENAINEK